MSLSLVYRTFNNPFTLLKDINEWRCWVQPQCSSSITSWLRPPESYQCRPPIGQPTVEHPLRLPTVQCNREPNCRWLCAGPGQHLDQAWLYTRAGTCQVMCFSVSIWVSANKQRFCHRRGELLLFTYLYVPGEEIYVISEGHYDLF